MEKEYNVLGGVWYWKPDDTLSDIIDEQTEKEMKEDEYNGYQTT